MENKQEQIRVMSESAARSYANRPLPKNRFEGQLMEMQKKKLLEMRQTEREQKIHNKRLNRLTRPKYFKPNEVIKNAHHYNKLSPEQRLRQSARNLFLDENISRSLNRTLDQTDVWDTNQYIYKLAGAGDKAEKSVERLKKQSPRRRKLTLREKMGHDPTCTTIRDVVDSFS